MSTIYKKALHSFFLKVHPDFFARNPQWQRTNETSIAQLNELLGWAKDVKGGATRAPPRLSTSFTFFRKPDDDVAADKPLEIQAQFDLPKGFVTSDQTRGVAERSVNKFLRDLLRRAECLDDAASSVSQAQDDMIAKAETRVPKRRRKKATEVRTLMDEAADSVSETMMPRDAPSIEDLVDSDQVLFSRELSPMQCAAALQTLHQSLPMMRYESWYLSPLIIGLSWGVGAEDPRLLRQASAPGAVTSTGIQGSITVPWDFTADQFLVFLAGEEAQIQKNRAALETTARMIEVLVADVCNALAMDDILISCSHLEAMECLRLVKANASYFSLHDVTGVTLEITDAFGFRDNGVVLIDHRADEKMLLRKVKKLQPKMKGLQQKYQQATSMLQSTQWHVDEFTKQVRPLAVDLYTHEGPTYAERLTFAKELHSCAGQLAHFDWSDFTFMLGPDVEIDWERKLAVLPFNFEGTALTRYVQDVNRDAKELERERLEEFEASRKVEEDQHRQRVSVGPGGAAQDPVDATGVPAADASPPHLPVHHQFGDQSTGVGSHTHARQEDAYMAEYLASSERGGEEMPVERPLHHQTSFTDDADATDQLQWQGFHQSPYARPSAPADDDEAMHGMLLSNRWHREAAVKKVVEDLDEKYGRSKRFAGLKLGDLVKINDPRAKAGGFPTITKGTYQGDGH